MGISEKPLSWQNLIYQVILYLTSLVPPPGSLWISFLSPHLHALSHIGASTRYALTLFWRHPALRPPLKSSPKAPPHSALFHLEILLTEHRRRNSILLATLNLPLYHSQFCMFYHLVTYWNYNFLDGKDFYMFCIPLDALWNSIYNWHSANTWQVISISLQNTKHKANDRPVANILNKSSPHLYESSPKCKWLKNTAGV